jgi:hypothetical protein
MRKPTIALASVVVASLAFTAPAHADETSFINNLHNIGLVDDGGESAMLNMGYKICDMLRDGVPPQELASRILYNSDKSQGDDAIGSTEADEVVAYAKADLCSGAA